ncbi:DUF1566 domain-containing protein [Leptospira sp. FAT2]|uniref:Lcl domain-containing protein n=1 Tax=Leptospira sanjuanensis TaxID=2879643 RepID=UPI001EE935C7|nr:DUF1566 domain-containing protein [Leptospira sanjuanensis]MCG6167180.1 DUF1566 domain-containing protein [Leptospira sanjuanensis]MCG6192639.1 DUF1566 domain-containing protein [Leptospira sanjuanensis]
MVDHIRKVLFLFCFCVLFQTCGTGKSDATPAALYNAFLSLLKIPVINNAGSIEAPGSNSIFSFSPGESVDLNGGSQGGSATGIVVDPSGNGTASGISVNGNGVPQIIFVNAAGGNPIGVDINGDGILDYYLCAGSGGAITLKTGPNCTGNTVTVYPGFGYDENGDGVVDNPILALIGNDSNPPMSSVYPPSGIYGGAQSVTITCADNLAPGNLVYSIDGTVPAFSPLVGYVKNPTTATFSVGSYGEGIYTVQYRCRDLAGNLEAVQSAVYEVNHNLPNVTVDGGATSSYVSAMNGAVNSISIFWKSNQSGTYSVRANGTGCSSGGILSTGSVAANASNTLTIAASSLSVGNNSIFICVTAGFTGQASFNVVRDDTAPTITADPGAGNYGKELSVSLKCNDNSGVPCSVIAYTIDGTNPLISGSLGTVTAGSTYSSSSVTATPISVPNGTLNRNIKFLARDKAGNVGAIQSAIFSVDTSLPTLNLLSTNPALYYGSVVIDNATIPRFNWEVSGNKVSYTLLKKRTSACSQCTTAGVADCPVGKFKDTNGLLYSSAGDCNCNNGISLFGSNTNASGPLGATNPIQVPSDIDPLNFSLGKNTLMICVANAQANFGPQYASREILVWKDLDVPQATNISPTINAHNVKPDPGEIVITFSEPMQNITPILNVQYFNGTQWVNFSFDTVSGATPNFSWNTGVGEPHNILTIRLPWIRFPENAFLRWEIDKNSLKDISNNSVQSNDVSGHLAGTFLTGSYFSTRASTFKTSLGKTGQKRCFFQSGGTNGADCKNNGSDLSDGTPREGQDGYFQQGFDFATTSFLNSAHSTNASSRDDKTTLFWQDSYSINGYADFNGALKACANLNRMNQKPPEPTIPPAPPAPPTYYGYADRDDWRLPSVEELETILAYENEHPLVSLGACSGIGNEMNFWTSSFFTSNLRNAWYVNFCERHVYFDLTANNKRVRCVSGNIPSQTP